jgi:hypothetical protein
MVVNAHWELVAANRAADVLFDGVAPALRTPPVNLLRLFTHPDGLPRILMSMRASPKRHELMAQDQCCGSARDALDGRVSSMMPSIDTNVDSMSLRMIRSR